MSQTFVKYTPTIEQTDPDFGKHLQTVVNETKQYVQNSVKSEGLNRAVRPAVISACRRVFRQGQTRSASISP
jgi:hypothetical protein